MAEVTTALLKPRRTVGDAVEHDVEFRDADGEVVSVGGGDTYNITNESAGVLEGDFIASETTINGKSLAEDVVLSAADIQMSESADSLEAVLADLKSKIAALEERVHDLETAQTD